MGRDLFIVDHTHHETISPWGECLVLENAVGDRAIAIPLTTLVSTIINLLESGCRAT